MAFSQRVSVSQFPLKTSHTGLEPTYVTSFGLNYLFKDPVSKHDPILARIQRQAKASVGEHVEKLWFSCFAGGIVTFFCPGSLPSPMTPVAASSSS